MKVPQRLLVAAVIGMCLDVPLVSQLQIQQQSSAPTFKAEVEYVEVDASVLDARGDVVRNLRKEDFQLFEDGKLQSIAGFSFVEIPPGTGDRELAVEPDVRSNEQPFAGRVYVLILDDLHTAAIRAPRVKRAAQHFIERHLSTNDLMAVVHVGGPSNGSQEFTGSKRLLTAAVDRFMGQKLESATLARNAQFFSGPSVATGAVGDPFDAERGFHAQATTRVLTEVAEKLSAIRGRRKTILLISEGIDYDISNVMDSRSATSIMEGVREAIAAATRSNASIYAVDPRGMTAMSDEAIEASIFADQRPITAQEDPAAAQGNPGKPGIGMSSLRTELQLSQDSLRALADETNGFAVLNANDFGSAFERIVSANSAYYVLAYYPPSSRRDGKFHRIDVRLSRPGLTVRARRGYVAPRSNAKPPRPGTDAVSPILLRALNNVVPADGLEMRLFAAPFKGVGPNTSVVVGLELKGSDLALADNQRVELAYVAVDASGTSRADTDSFTFKLPAQTRAHIKETGIRFLNRLNLPPGRYQLRVGAYDVATGTVGTLGYDLDVPDFSKLPLGMSGLLVMSKAASSTVMARGDAELQTFMSAPPVSLRTFPQNDAVTVVAEIYDRLGRTPHTVDVATTVRSHEGAIVFERNDQRSSGELQGNNGAYVQTVAVPVRDLAPGRYVLTVEARSRLGPTASRRIAFGVTAAP